MTVLNNPPSQNRLKDKSPPHQAVSTAFTTFAGPVPPPEYLSQYEKLCPGIAKKFLEGPHLEAEHRRDLEKQLVRERIRLSRRGQWMAFFLALISVIAAFAAIFMGNEIAGLGTFFIAVASLVGIFAYSKKQQQNP